MERRIVPQRIWVGLLSAAVCGCHTTKPHTTSCQYPPWPAEAATVDRQLLLDPLNQQARNGDVLNSTMFNHHFKDITEEEGPNATLKRKATPTPTSELLLSGKNLMHRLARSKPSGTEWRLFVEVARDVDVKPKQAKTQTTFVDLNRKRVEEVTEYAQSLRPDLIVRVDLIDPSPVGMSAREAQYGVLKHTSVIQGTILTDKYAGDSSSIAEIAPPPAFDEKAVPSSAPGALSPGGS